MNARTIRRAIERKQARQAQKEARQQPANALAASPSPSLPMSPGQNETLEAAPAASEARLVANRLNAQFSTGPRTAEGKSVSSRNAVRTALTGRTVLLPTDDADRYGAHCHAFLQELSPEGQRELILTQSLADNAWRIERIASFEMAIFAKGRALFAAAHAEEPAPIRAALIEHDIYQANERELRNLHLQEGRLRRQRDRDNEELRRLQAERRAAASSCEPTANEKAEENVNSVAEGSAAVGFENSDPAPANFVQTADPQLALHFHAPSPVWSSTSHADLAA